MPFFDVRDSRKGGERRVMVRTDWFLLIPAFHPWASGKYYFCVDSQAEKAENAIYRRPERPQGEDDMKNVRNEYELEERNDFDLAISTPRYSW